MSNLCDNLQEQLHSAEQERQKLENARCAATRELAYTRAELERYQRDTEDLSKQVAFNSFVMMSKMTSVMRSVLDCTIFLSPLKPPKNLAGAKLHD